MSAQPLIVIGGGEHARVVAAAARTRPGEWRIMGYTDRSGRGRLDPGLPFLGDDAHAARLAESASPSDRPLLVLGVGRPLDARLAIVDAFGSGTTWATVVHSTAWVADDVHLGEGVVALAGAIVNPGARIGAHAIVNSGAIVEHDVVVGRGSHVGPGAMVGGGAVIGDGVLLGIGAVVRDHVVVGSGAVVGMGAVVISDVAERATVVGVPARPLRAHQ